MALESELENLNGMLMQSKVEFRQYQAQRDKPVLLQQAGEKLFNCVELYLTLKYNTRIESYAQAYQLSRNERSDSKLLYDARELHRFFYNYTEQFPDIREAVKQFVSVRDRLNVKLRGIGKRYAIRGINEG